MCFCCGLTASRFVQLCQDIRVLRGDGIPVVRETITKSDVDLAGHEGEKPPVQSAAFEVRHMEAVADPGRGGRGEENHPGENGTAWAEGAETKIAMEHCDCEKNKEWVRPHFIVSRRAVTNAAMRLYYVRQVSRNCVMT